MAGIPYRAGKWFARRKATRRAVPLMWAFAVAEALAATRRHFSGVDPKVRRRAVELARKSKGRPSNLTAHEKQELRRLVGRDGPLAAQQGTGRGGLARRHARPGRSALAQAGEAAAERARDRRLHPVAEQAELAHASRA